MDNEQKKSEKKNDVAGESQAVRPAAVVPRFRKLKWIVPVLAAVGLIAAVIGGVVSMAHQNHAEEVSEVSGEVVSQALKGVKGFTEQDRQRELERQRKAEEIIKKIEETKAEYRASVEHEYEAFKRRVGNRASGFDAVRCRIPHIVDQYGYSKCWDIVCAMAKDYFHEKTGLGSESNFDNLMNADLRDGFYQPLMDARTEVIKLLDEFTVRLESCRQEFGRAVLEIPQWDYSLGEAPQSLMLASRTIEELQVSLISAQAGAMIGVALDVSSIVVTVVVRILGGSAARLGASAVAGAGTAMLDSPAPGPADIAGAAIFCAGVAATAWDVWKASRQIPRALNDTMRKTVDSECQEVQRRVLEEGEKLFLDYTRIAGASGVAK